MIKIGLDVPRGVGLKGSLRHKKDENGKPLYDDKNEPVMELSPDAYVRALAGARFLSACPLSSARPTRSGGTGGGHRV